MYCLRYVRLAFFIKAILIKYRCVSSCVCQNSWRTNLHVIRSAYQLYLGMNAAHAQGHDSSKLHPSVELKTLGKKANKAPKLTERDICEQFKKALSYKDVAIHFVGVWCVIRPLVPEVLRLTADFQGYCLSCRYRTKAELAGDCHRDGSRSLLPPLPFA